MTCDGSTRSLHECMDVWMNKCMGGVLMNICAHVGVRMCVVARFTQPFKVCVCMCVCVCVYAGWTSVGHPLGYERIIRTLALTLNPNARDSHFT